VEGKIECASNWSCLSRTHQDWALDGFRLILSYIAVTLTGMTAQHAALRVGQRYGPKSMAIMLGGFMALLGTNGVGQSQLIRVPYRLYGAASFERRLRRARMNI